MRSLIVAIVGACIWSGGAFAQEEASREPGDWLVRVGATYVSPKSNNSDIVDVDEAVSLTFNGTYMFSKNAGLELLAAMPFEHDVNLKADGSEVATVKQLPPTLTMQWHLNPIGRLIPYAGVGLNYTVFFDESTTGALAGSRLDLDPSWGLTGQVGADFQVGSNWFLNVDVRYIQIETEAKLDGVNVGEVKVDPWTVGLNVGWIF